MIYKIIDIGISNNASDIHLKLNIQPILRIYGELKIFKDFNIVENYMMNSIVNQLLNTEMIEKYDYNKFIDLSKTYKNRRLRIHIYREGGNSALSIRIIPLEIPNLKDLNLPIKLKDFIHCKNGLILVTGVAGSGKSTTLAALINEVNSNESKHIITIEDPIEYIHESNKSIISQKEIGRDINNFKDAITSAMREDPDILLLGELRDLDSITSAITMAETGHLVFGTLHTKSVSETIDRIIDVFPSNQQRQVRVQLANSIRGIISQELLPMISGGMIPCCEIMVANDAIKNLIREQSNINSINDQIQMNYMKIGSQSKLQSYANLISENKISLDIVLNGLTESERKSLNRLL